MTLDDVLYWIASKNVQTFQNMQDTVTDDKQWDRNKGAYDVMKELEHYILIKTNPHNREDITKFNKRNSEVYYLEFDENGQEVQVKR